MLGEVMLKQSMARPTLAALSGVMLVSGCGSPDGGAETERFPAYEPFDVVSLHPGTRNEGSVAVAGARVLTDGSTQLLVEGGSCSVPTRVEIREQAGSVEATAFAHRSSGDCTMESVPWFVPITLQTSLLGRSLHDGASHDEARVVECATSPEDPWCKRPTT